MSASENQISFTRAMSINRPGGNSKFLSASNLFLLTLLAWFAGPSQLDAFTFTNIFSVSNSVPTGFKPLALTQHASGNFYGTTGSGGTNGVGTFFRLSQAGTLTYLHHFYTSNGAPNHVIIGADGNFYGVTPGLGNGTSNNGNIFVMTPSGTLTNLVSFRNTNAPFGVGGGTLIQGNDGNFYGTTLQGGIPNDFGATFGTIFKMTAAGAFTTLISFNGTNGGGPSPLFQGADGYLYGSLGMGTNFSGRGVIFKMTTSGLLSILFSSDDDQFHPGGLVAGPDGNFYGLTSDGGTYGNGVAFRMTPLGALTPLASLDRTNSGYSRALILGKDNAFYGTTTFGGS